MRKFKLFICLTIVLLASGAAAQESNEAVPTISSEYPNIDKEFFVETKYKCEVFPDPSIHFGKVDVTQWIGKLEKLEENQVSDCMTIVWDNFGIVRYLWTIKDYQTSDFYFFDRDKVEKLAVFPDSRKIFMTEAGVYKWQYIYMNDRVDRVNYVIYPMNRSEESNPLMLYQIDIVKYWGDSDVPLKITSYKSLRDMQNNRWDSVQKYNASGQKVDKTMKREIKNEY